MALAMTCLWTTTHAQVGINTITPDAILDVEATDSGILIPRIALTAADDATTVATPTISELIYNTATAGTAPNNVTPGYYYWNGTVWVRLNAGTDATTAWSLTGNAGTNPANNFVGTTDAQALQLRTNGTARLTIPNANQVHAMSNGTQALPFYSWSADTNMGIFRQGTDVLGFSTNGTERMRINSDGRVLINTTTFITGDIFRVVGGTGQYAVNGYSSEGTGVYGQNSSGVGNGVFGNSSNVGVRGYGANGAILESGLNAGYGAIAWNTTATGDNRTGLLVMGQNLGALSFPSTGAILRGMGSGGAAFASNTTGTGFVAAGNGILTQNMLEEGSGIAGTGLQFGVYGYATQTGINNNDGSFSSAGGYFANAYGGWSAVGGWWDPPGGGNNDQNFKIIGTGSVSTIVKDTENKDVVMYAPETPEVLFQDYGIGRLINGKAKINLDPILVKNIIVNDKHPLKVFIQLEGDCNGVYVTNKTAQGFEVVELQGGKSNVPFSWSITATRANETFVAKDGTIRISNNSQRFPYAPKILETKEQSAKEDPSIINKSLSNAKMIKTTETASNTIEKSQENIENSSELNSNDGKIIDNN